MAVKIETISARNLEVVVALLQERTGTTPAYTRWKYGSSNGNCVGFVAFQDAQPVGCHGILARNLLLPDQSTIPFGWTADWYSSARAGASQASVATALLVAAARAYPLMFAQPKPLRARSLFQSAGFASITFQSRRRLVFHRYRYQRARTRWFLKALWLTAWHTLHRKAEPPGSSVPNIAEISPTSPAIFADAEEYGRHILAQPVSPLVRRSTATWSGDEAEIVFMDDRFPNGDLRRRVLRSSGRGKFSPPNWHRFCVVSRNAGAVYLELFTTERDLDSVWASLGATPYPDAPILVRGKLPCPNLLLHGWDLETWTVISSIL
jgi:hypothetical protein